MQPTLQKINAHLISYNCVLNAIRLPLALFWFKPMIQFVLQPEAAVSVQALPYRSVLLGEWKTREQFEREGAKNHWCVGTEDQVVNWVWNALGAHGIAANGSGWHVIFAQVIRVDSPSTAWVGWARVYFEMEECAWLHAHREIQ